jgi:phage terminase large subunit-like protein
LTDETRRFRIAFVEVPRKNGKTTLAAGIGLYLLVADGEAGAEVYCAATKRDQAKLVFADMKAFVRLPGAGRAGRAERP